MTVVQAVAFGNEIGPNACRLEIYLSEKDVEQIRHGHAWIKTAVNTNSFPEDECALTVRLLEAIITKANGAAR